MKDKEYIYVIGFPKSGNTWLARLLAEITFSRIAATNPVDDADNSIDRKGDYLIFKLHDTGEMFLEEGVRVVYIIRDIRDMLVSAFFFNNPFIREDWIKLDNKSFGIRRLLSRAYFRHQIRRMSKKWCGNELSGLINWINGNKKTIGSWSSHIKSWAKHSNAVIVKYEDLLQDTESEMKRVLSQLEINANEVKIKEAIVNQSFSKKKSEFLSSGDSQNSQFLRAGEAGSWSKFLSNQQVKEIELVHGDVMRKYGYLLKFPEV